MFCGLLCLRAHVVSVAVIIYECFSLSRARALSLSLSDPDGDIYEGEFRFGRREGRGKYKYSKGECYEVCVLFDRLGIRV
jgi:hypothetical protein